MFQTEPIHALQSLASEGMTAFMLGVTALGYSWALIPILLVIAFGVDFRRGFVLVQIVVWNGLLTDVLKAAFALPRPEAVDSTLLRPGDPDPEIVPFERMGAPAFWAGLPAEVVGHYRALGEFSYGMPSGHCSVTTAMWSSAAALFRKPWLWLLALALIVLMPLSRMYLARHFIADVLGGIGLGMFVFSIGWAIAIRPIADRERRSVLEMIPMSAPALRAFLYLATPPLAALVLDAGHEGALRIFGINLGLWLLTRTGLPLGGGTLQHRAARVLLSFALYLVSDRLLTSVLEQLLGESDVLEAAIQCVSAFVTVWGTTIVCYRVGLYRRGAPGVGLLETPSA